MKATSKIDKVPRGIQGEKSRKGTAGFKKRAQKLKHKQNTKELMQCHCGTNNRAPRLTFTDPCKPEVRPGDREESASPAWLSAPAMNARDTRKVHIWRLGTGCGPTLYIGSATATTHQEKQVPKKGTEQGVRRGKRSLLLFHTRRKCPMETSRNSVKVKFGIKVIKLVEIRENWSQQSEHMQAPMHKWGMPHPLQMLHGNYPWLSFQLGLIETAVGTCCCTFAKLNISDTNKMKSTTVQMHKKS